MPDRQIDNPILNSPYHEPTRHHRFDELGITNEIEESRRRSAYFIPIAKARGAGRQLPSTASFTSRVRALGLPAGSI